MPVDGTTAREAAQLARRARERSDGPAAVKLTKAQLDELERLAKEPQSSFGKGRVRIHNNLRRHGLAHIYHDDGFRCQITQAGRDYLSTHFTPADRARQKKAVQEFRAIPPVPFTKPAASHSDRALDEAHKICSPHIHCGTRFGAREHSQLEQDVARALNAAFYRGKNS